MCIFSMLSCITCVIMVQFTLLTPFNKIKFEHWHGILHLIWHVFIIWFCLHVETFNIGWQALMGFIIKIQQVIGCGSFLWKKKSYLRLRILHIVFFIYISQIKLLHDPFIFQNWKVRYNFLGKWIRNRKRIKKNNINKISN